MVRILVAASLLGAPTLALACGGAKTLLAAATSEAAASGEVAAIAAVSVDPTHCAKNAELVGSNCSYSTGMMAQRVLEEGKPYTFTGKLAPSSNELRSRVAAPYVIGPESEVNVVANEVVESLVASGAGAIRITVTGRLLEVDGIQYFVATEYEQANS